MSLAICMIVRDEAPVLVRCLESVLPLLNEGDEIICLDTGSTDQTPRLARDGGALLYRAAWADDFSAARNACLDAATDRGHRWALVLDADETIAPDTWAALRRWIDSAGESAAMGLAEVHNTTHDGQVVRLAHPRVLRLDSVRYHGRVHEQPRVNPRLIVQIQAPSPTGLIIHHDGYTRQELKRKGKARRNLGLLRAALADLPIAETEARAYHHWQIARSLGQLWATGEQSASALPPEQDPDHPLSHLMRMAEEASRSPARVADPGWIWLPIAAVDLARALRVVSRSASALKTIWASQRTWPDLADLYLQEAEILAECERPESDARALAALDRAEALGPADPARYPGARADMREAAAQLRAQITARRGVTP